MQMMCSLKLFLSFCVRTRSTLGIYFIASIASTYEYVLQRNTKIPMLGHTVVIKEYLKPGMSHHGRLIYRGKITNQIFEKTLS